MKVDGKSHALNLRGGDGGDFLGSGSDGLDATNCRQPLGVMTHLVGAPGGNGGNAGFGGAGGRGGDVDLVMDSLDDLNKLKRIEIVNAGGRPGRGGGSPGRGGLGCRCQVPQWQIQQCHWALYQNERIVDEQTIAGEFCAGSPPNNWPNSEDWRLLNVSQKTFVCRDGADGADGAQGSRHNGNYGDVRIVVGSKSSSESRWQIEFGKLVDKTVTLSGAASSLRSGLRALLASGSDVQDVFIMANYVTRRFQFVWNLNQTASEVGVEQFRVDIRLDNPMAPKWELNLPPQLRRKAETQGDMTVITFTELLDSTDPGVITRCAQHSGKGSLVCEINSQCRYDAGECIPR